MANITEEHLHHMARRHHATMQKLDTMREKITGYAQKSFGLLETGAGAWAGGLIEGRWNGPAFLGLPANLLAGVGLLVAGYANLGGPTYSKHFENLGNGFVGSYLAAMGYNFGKNWREGKPLFGPSTPLNPYDDLQPPPGVSGDLSDAQMAAIVQRMQAAAAAPAQS